MALHIPIRSALHDQLPRILDHTSRHPLQFRLPVCLAVPCPGAQPVGRLDAERLVPLLDDAVDLARTEVFLLRGRDGRGALGVGLQRVGTLVWVEQEGVEVRGDGDQGVDGGDVHVLGGCGWKGGVCTLCGGGGSRRRGLDEVDVAELGDDGAGLDELVEEVVVRGWVREEGVAGRYAESNQVDERGGERVDVWVAGEVGDVGGEEAHEGEQCAPELGPVVVQADFVHGEVCEEAEEDCN